MRGLAVMSRSVQVFEPLAALSLRQGPVCCAPEFRSGPGSEVASERASAQRSAVAAQVWASESGG